MSGLEKEPAVPWLFPLSFNSIVLLPSLVQLKPAPQVPLQGVLAGHPNLAQRPLYLLGLQRGHEAQALLFCTPKVQLKNPDGGKV